MEIHPAWIGAAVVLALAIVGGLITLFSRLTKVETEVGIIKDEVTKLRKHWHDFRDGTMRDAWNLFSEWKDEMAATFKRKDEPRKRRGDDTD